MINPFFRNSVPHFWSARLSSLLFFLYFLDDDERTMKWKYKYSSCMFVWVISSWFWFGTERPISISYLLYYADLLVQLLLSFRLAHHKNGSIQKHIYPSQIPIGVIFCLYFQVSEISPLPFFIYFAHTSYYDISMTLSGLQTFFYYIWNIFFRVFLSLYQPERQRHTSDIFMWL